MLEAKMLGIIAAHHILCL